MKLKTAVLLDLQVSDKPYCGPVYQCKEERGKGRTIQPFREKKCSHIASKPQTKLLYLI